MNETWDGCEWNPGADEPAFANDKHHLVCRAEVVVGTNGNWRLCAGCAKLARFKAFKVRKEIKAADAKASQAMKLHERTRIVEKAGARIRQVVADALKPDELTYIEFIQVMNEIQASWLRYALREERHPDDPEKRADEE